jgi:hypothetical protein
MSKIEIQKANYVRSMQGFIIPLRKYLCGNVYNIVEQRHLRIILHVHVHVWVKLLHCITSLFSTILYYTLILFHSSRVSAGPGQEKFDATKTPPALLSNFVSCRSSFCGSVPLILEGSSGPNQKTSYSPEKPNIKMKLRL